MCYSKVEKEQSLFQVHICVKKNFLKEIQFDFFLRQLYAICLHLLNFAFMAEVSHTFLLIRCQQTYFIEGQPTERLAIVAGHPLCWLQS